MKKGEKRMMLPIRYRYLVILLCIGAFCTAGIALGSNLIFKQELTRTLSESIQNSMEKALINMQTVLNRVEVSTDLISQIEWLEPVADGNAPEMDSKDFDRQLVDTAALVDIPLYLYVIDASGNLYSNMPLVQNERERIQKRLTEEAQYRGAPTWNSELHTLGMCDNVFEGEGSAECFYYTKNIIVNGEYQGRCVAGTESYILTRTMQNVALDQAACLYVFDDNNRLLFSIPSETDSEAADAFWEKLLAMEQGKAMTLGGVKHTVLRVDMPQGWKAVMTTPTRGMGDQQSVLWQTTLLFALMSVLFVVLCVGIIHYNLVKPIAYLEKKVEEVRDGDLSIHCALSRNDELGVLNDGINEMLERIQTMLAQNLKNEREKQQLEYSIHQMQISPHFLYNTLNTIRWIAEINSQKQISSSICSLINMLEYNKKWTDKLVELSTELAYVEEYVKLLEIRYFNRVLVHYEIEPETESCLVPKLFLQPLIENSIMHGLGDKRTKLEILVQCFLREGQLNIRLQDNGIGIEPERLEEIRKSLADVQPINAEGIGIGLRNTHARAVLEFGNQYHISIQSVPNEQTVVHIQVPAIRLGCERNENTNC